MKFSSVALLLVMWTTINLVFVENVEAENSEQSIYDKCQEEHATNVDGHISLDVDGYDACLKGGTVIVAPTKEELESINTKALVSPTRDPKSKQHKDKSDRTVQAICRDQYSNENSFHSCLTIYSECVQFDDPKTKKEELAFSKCMDDVTSQKGAEWKRENDAEQAVQREHQQKMIDQQNAQNEEMVEIQRQQLQLQQQQQRLQQFNAIQQAFPAYRPTTVTPYFMPTKAPTQTNCTPTYGGGMNCTSY